MSRPSIRSRWAPTALLTSVTVAAFVAVLVGSSSTAAERDEGPDHGRGLGATHSCADPALQIPDHAPVNTVLDPENGTIELAVTPDGGGMEKVFTVDYRGDASCRSRAEVRHVIDHAVATWETSLSEQCADLARFNASGETTLRGAAVDRDALEEHLRQWC
jgi:hypothetical protein